jgi:hypothetical protein
MQKVVGPSAIRSSKDFLLGVFQDAAVKRPASEPICSTAALASGSCSYSLALDPRVKDNADARQLEGPRATHVVGAWGQEPTRRRGGAAIPRS